MTFNRPFIHYCLVTLRDLFKEFKTLTLKYVVERAVSEFRFCLSLFSVLPMFFALDEGREKQASHFVLEGLHARSSHPFRT